MNLQKKLASMAFALCAAAMATRPALAADQPATAPATAKVQSEYVKPNVKHEPYGNLNIVVPLTTDDKRVQGMKLRNITNSLEAVETWKGNMQVVVVIYAKGISLVKNPEEKIQKQLDALRAKGVQFMVCDNTLHEQGINFHKLYNVTEADIVPSGFAEVAYLQAQKHYMIDSSN